MPHYLLTGAGFSRNWGGWLANEVFEYLIGAHGIDDPLRNLLWMTKLRGEGFESALSVAQSSYLTEKSSDSARRLNAITEAIVGMFGAMQAAFDNLDYREDDLKLQEFLSRFDAIFTLNQDTLLETIYAGPVRWSERWYGSYLPYMRFKKRPDQSYQFMLRESLIQDNSFAVDENHQPIFKLHGSYNWFADDASERMVIIGGNKDKSIEAFPVLARYQAEFRSLLSQPNTSLMIVGYSFNDAHINSAIQNGATTKLRLFIVDPLGVDVLDKRNVKAQITQPIPPLLETLMPCIIGASRRSIRETLTKDAVELAKLERFFEGQSPITRMLVAKIDD